MSLYTVLVTSTGIGRAGTDKVLVSGDFPHIHEAREAIHEWAAGTFVAPVIVNISFQSHATEIFVTDLVSGKFDKVVIL